MCANISLLSILLGVLSEMKLLNHMVALFCTRSARRFQFLHILAGTCYFLFFWQRPFLRVWGDIRLPFLRTGYNQYLGKVCELCPNPVLLCSLSETTALVCVNHSAVPWGSCLVYRLLIWVANILSQLAVCLFHVLNFIYFLFLVKRHFWC